MNRLTRWLVTLVGIAFVLYLAIGWFFSGLIITPSGRTDADVYLENPERWEGKQVDYFTDQLSEPEEFTFAAHDGLTLFGRLYPHENPAKPGCAVILAHGWGSTGLSMVKVAWIYYERGCHVMTYDHRALGQSEGEYGSFGVYESQDLIMATRWLEDRTGLETDQIAWAGESYGATAILQAAPQEPNIAFVVADSSYRDLYSVVGERAVVEYGGWVRALLSVSLSIAGQRGDFDYREASPVLAAPDIAVPVLLIHSKDDPETASSQSVSIYEQLNPETTRFHHLSWGSGHSLDSITRPDEYAQLVHDFIDGFAAEFGQTPD